MQSRHTEASIGGWPTLEVDSSLHHSHRGCRSFAVFERPAARMPTPRAFNQIPDSVEAPTQPLPRTTCPSGPHNSHGIVVDPRLAPNPRARTWATGHRAPSYFDVPDKPTHTRNAINAVADTMTRNTKVPIAMPIQ